MKNIVLILGNPGTGKSSIVNCLAGSVVFHAGVSFGSGLTNELEVADDNGVTYMDTPGLADAALEKSAAEAIKSALTRTGSYRVFFMVRLNDGRVVQEDIETIQRVMDSIEVEGLLFSVIVNKVSSHYYSVLVEGPEFDQEKRDKVLAQINAGKHKTPSIFFLKKIKELAHKTNAVVQLPQDFRNFIDGADRIVITTQEEVKEISLDAQVKNKLREEIAAKTKEAENAKKAAEILQAANDQHAREAEASRFAAAKREANRLKDCYGNGVSVKFIITNHSQRHALTLSEVRIHTGKKTSDPYVKFPEAIAPQSSEAGFHAKKDAEMSGSYGDVAYTMNGSEVKIAWEQPYSGAFRSYVSTGRGIEVEHQDMDGSTATVFVAVRESS